MWSGVRVVVGRRDGGGGVTDVYISQNDRFFCPGVGFEPSNARISFFHWFFHIVKMDKINPLNGGTCTFFFSILFYLSQTKSQSLYNQGCQRWVNQSSQQKILVTFPYVYSLTSPRYKSLSITIYDRSF